jgi:hypothetical protein
MERSENTMTRSGDDTETENSFDPLSMIEMWQDLHKLMEQWSATYGTTTDLAATAFREFGRITIQPTTHTGK